MTKPFNVSPRVEARLAGVLYLFSIVFGLAAMTFMRRKMLVRGDQANLIAGVLYSAMTLLLSHLLWPVNKWISAVAAIVSLAGSWLPQFFWYNSAHINNNLFFGLYCLFTGYLVWRSRFFPKTVGALMAFAGVCWLITTWPALVHATSPFPGIAGLVGEGTLMGYLIIRGVDEQRWREDNC
jgi:Domain of unknown function (DUF4386)